MNAQALIDDAKRAGVTITLRGVDTLDVRGPEQTLASWGTLIKARKIELISWLRQPANDSGHEVPVTAPEPDNKARRAWTLHYLEQAPVDSFVSPPATHAEMLANNPEAIGASPVKQFTPMETMTLSDREENCVRVWLHNLGEKNPHYVDMALTQCRSDECAREYYFKQAGLQND